jgi:hypothetical protein
MINCRPGEMRLLAISPFIACSREDKLAGRRSPHTFCVDLSLSQLASPNPPTGTQGGSRLLVCLSFGIAINRDAPCYSQNSGSTAKGTTYDSFIKAFRSADHEHSLPGRSPSHPVRLLMVSYPYKLSVLVLCQSLAWNGSKGSSEAAARRREAGKKLDSE